MRKIIVSGLAVLALAACGTTEDPTAADETAPSSGERITVTDSRGKEVVLDGPAERVAATEWNAVEHLVSLGVMPVGVSDIKGYGQWVSSEPLDDTPTDIGTRGEPSMDTLAQLDLDLVVVTDSLVEGALEQIEKDTPVIVLTGGDSADPIGAMWENVDILAEATGTEDRAAELRSDWDTKVADGRAAIAEAGADGSKVAFSDAYADSGSVSIRPFTSGSLIGGVLAELGFENAWSMEGDAVYGLAQADVEGLTNLPDDVRFWYIANSAEGDPYADQLADNAIWRNLPFVKAGTVHRFPDSIWMFGGPTSMAQLIDAAVDAVS
ncbi:ABC transporter substrate-binding protein [Actinophytocola gossypii]|uniref:Iron-siderophore ABC transporter substrate-binding protein n=1 Tax=Actinophytocola gossypii TaxID=2812003 RepID=A0ABT2J777_9PSEU|nr:iron-siderophore ABC transporter substrate-binding protein [Actinophytocola gossypii]MCT2583708.1 iron-siderophore ABC transporter substrate-binding protein [Actinophytocola gossypii]